LLLILSAFINQPFNRPGVFCQHRSLGWCFAVRRMNTAVVKMSDEQRDCMTQICHRLGIAKRGASKAARELPTGTSMLLISSTLAKTEAIV
jgi:hypothetical protein